MPRWAFNGPQSARSVSFRARVQLELVTFHLRQEIDGHVLKSPTFMDYKSTLGVHRKAVRTTCKLRYQP